MIREEFFAHIRLPFLLSFLLLSVLALLSLIPHSPAVRTAASAALRRSAEPAIVAHAYLVRLVGDPSPIVKRREWKRMAPASLTKLMTAVIAKENLGAEEMVPFSRDAKAVEQKISSARTGEAFLRDDAIRMALIASYNDAALALADAAGRKSGTGNGGFVEDTSRFIGLMNDKASAIGMRDTHFENPTGLDEDGQYASAEDLARISEYVFAAHPDLWEISRTTETVVYSDGGDPHALLTTDKLLHEFPALRGGKTGFTDRAQGALILLYPIHPRSTAIIVILGSPDRFGDGRKIIRFLEENFL